MRTASCFCAATSFPGTKFPKEIFKKSPTTRNDTSAIARNVPRSPGRATGNSTDSPCSVSTVAQTSLCYRRSAGLPIHEAVAVGLPVVATNHSGPAALVADAGILLPSHETEGTKSTYVPGPTPREIADAILYVKNNPDAAKHLAQAAKLRVTTLFSPEIVADIMMNHLEADFPSFPQKAASLKTTR